MPTPRSATCRGNVSPATVTSPPIGMTATERNPATTATSGAIE